MPFGQGEKNGPLVRGPWKLIRHYFTLSIL
jgi:hypothetical protein